MPENPTTPDDFRDVPEPAHRRAWRARGAAVAAARARRTWRDGAAVALLLLGLLQMGADMIGADTVRGLAAATVASPAPKVFSAVRGLETFSTQFFLEWRDSRGTDRSLLLTPAVYSRIRGPYNRRNVFGAALAYGPVLATDARTADMFESVSRYAMCEPPAALLWELGLGEGNTNVRVRLLPREGSRLQDLPVVLEAPCRRS